METIVEESASRVELRELHPAEHRGRTCGLARRRLGRRRRPRMGSLVDVQEFTRGVHLREMHGAERGDATRRRARGRLRRHRRGWARVADSVHETDAGAPARVRGMHGAEARSDAAGRARRRVVLRWRLASQRGGGALAHVGRRRRARRGCGARRRRARVVGTHQAHRTVRRALILLVEQQRLHAPVTHAANLRCGREASKAIGV